MPTELPPRDLKRPLRTPAGSFLWALAFVLIAAAAQAQIGIVGPSAPSPAYILLGQGHGAGAGHCAAAAPAPYDRNVRRGQESNPGGTGAQIDAHTGLPCPSR
jgi:hypothetical protein